MAAAEILKERGAYKIYVMATHGILSAEAPRLIEESSIDEVCLRARLLSASPERLRGSRAWGRQVFRGACLSSRRSAS